jgi:uncharacterized protein with NAD-binding domain and iron-sulfur cluster
MRRHVIVLGGGVAGMSAAHELAERGFRVTVFERGRAPGGKARSFGVPGTAADDRRDLPAEHGFRFFPGFYRHLPDTMKRIPYPGNREGVFDNLVPATQMQILLPTPGRPAGWRSQLVLPARFPTSLSEVRTVLGAANVLTTSAGLTPADMDFYAERVWQLLTSCEERRADTLEGRSWWDYIDAAHRPAEYQNILGRTPRVLVAADPQVANARTMGDILLQLLFNLTEPGVSADRVLNGPTNEAWIDPWLGYLRARQVAYRLGAEVRAIECSARGRITGVRIRQNGRDRLETADYYVAALPVERMAKLLTPRMLRADPALEGITVLAGHVDWMNGIQFYLTREVPSAYGHQMYLGSPWALTSLFQAQFWYETRSFARHYGDGTVQTVLSVDVSDWNTPGINGKAARQCGRRRDIAAEVWAQLKASLPALADADLHPRTPWHLDPAIRVVNGVVRNDEPLLVNRVNSWPLRPWARTRIPNLFLASDYVRTYTNLATMEAANEAARRAVNAILDESGAGGPRCQLWELHEPVWVKPWRWWDLARYRRGLPWAPDLPDFVQRMARAVLAAAPAVGGPDAYADARARQVAEAGVGVVPTWVQTEIADTVLEFATALARGDIATLRTLVLPGEEVVFDGRRYRAADWIDELQRLSAAGGRVRVDVRSVQAMVPSGRGVMARFVVEVAVDGTTPLEGRPGRLHAWLVPAPASPEPAAGPRVGRGRSPASDHGATGPGRWRIGGLWYQS